MIAIAVLGAGIVGRTLAARWTRAGHEVILGSRDPGSARVAGAVAETGAVRAATHAEAARGAELSVVTVPGEQVEALVVGLGDSLAGRVVVDATNVLAPDAPVLHHVDTLAAAGAVVYRAFNSTGWEQMAQPVFGTQRSDMPYAGPDGQARAVVEAVIADIGFRPVWVGDGPAALATTDALARLWFQLAFGLGWGRRLGLRLLTAADDTAADDTADDTADDNADSRGARRPAP
jgi:predicted dinucleotide-binding enzyme